MKRLAALAAMVLMEQSLNQAGALREAMLIWPECEVMA